MEFYGTIKNMEISIDLRFYCLQITKETVLALKKLRVKRSSFKLITLIKSR